MVSLFDLPTEIKSEWHNYLNSGGSLSDVLGLDEEQLESFYTLAYQMYEAGNLLDAKKLFQFLCMAEHMSSKYFIGLGAVQKALGDFRSAGEAFSYALVVDPKKNDAIYFAAECQYELGQLKEAANGYKYYLAMCKESNDFGQWHKQAQDRIIQLNNKLSSIKEVTE
ncbi:SycD/LcrH family type III secretion system chaperone [Pleionea sediminis]|uniref:SycD/LcrH family type III secretion system chaperone n=1 Tax=Pleionea sediminis TaxID=2569479 RepID=UPI001185E1B5|nr:SycD/LcrH family type III secretion system chaperone [Pleionea sediminis]